MGRNNIQMIAFNLSLRRLAFRTPNIFSTMSGRQTEISSANISAISISDTHDLFMKKAPRVAAAGNLTSKRGNCISTEELDGCMRQMCNNASWFAMQTDTRAREGTLYKRVRVFK